MSSRVAIITGASRGIGHVTALTLAKEGMHIVVNYLNSEEPAQELVGQINTFSRAIAVKADVADAAQVRALREASLSAFGRVDVLVNNAGAIIRPGDWQSLTDESWQRTLDVNLKGVFHCIRAFAPLFQDQKSGKIINLTSTYGMLGAAPIVAYTAAKAAVINLTLSFAKELAPFVTVNAIAPGNIDTDMTRGAGDELIQMIIDETPLGRLGTPEDVAHAVAFLASPRADFITGHVLVVDGGHRLR